MYAPVPSSVVETVYAVDTVVSFAALDVRVGFVSVCYAVERR